MKNPKIAFDVPSGVHCLPGETGWEYTQSGSRCTYTTVAKLSIPKNATYTFKYSTDSSSSFTAANVVISDPRCVISDSDGSGGSSSSSTTTTTTTTTSSGSGGSGGGGVPDNDAEPVFSENFDSLATNGTWLSSCKWNKHTRVTAGCGVTGSKCLRIAQDPFAKEPPLFPLPPVEERPPYPAGSDGVCEPYYTNTATDVVQAVKSILPGVEYSLNYDIYFEPGYDWARGGKLPGLSAKEWDSGCSVEGDGIQTDPGPDRWSVRLMWRESGTNELYVYDQDRTPGACGTRGPTTVPFVTGVWTAVTAYVKLNSKANLNDGIVQLYLDGQLVRNETGVRLRGSESNNSKINNIFFSTFYGGNESKRLHCIAHPDDAQYCAARDPKIDVTWVPENVSYVRFDNLAVYPGLRVRTASGR